MKIILWSAISILCLALSGRSVLAQAEEQTAEARCQLLDQQPRTDSLGAEGGSSSQTLLARQIEAMCQLNGQRPRTDEGAIATADKPSPEHFTVPSLWWQQQQVGDAINNRLVDNWRAYTDTVSLNTGHAIPHIDVIVNGQIWPLLNYLERYSMITQFGESAKNYGYQLRIFTGSRLVGLHVCDFDTAAETQSDQNTVATTADNIATPVCVVELNYFGQGAIRGGRQR